MVEIKEDAAGWDGEGATQSLFKWATCPKNGKLRPKLLKPYFMRITGDGKSPENYSYPVGKMVDGKPQYDRNGMIAAFTAAMGSHTGTVDSKLAKDIVDLFEQESGSSELTSGMTQIKNNNTVESGTLIKTYKNSIRSASVFKTDNGSFYVSVDSDNNMHLNAASEDAALDIAYEYAKSGRVMVDGTESNAVNIRYNAVSHYGKVLVETPEYIDIPVIPMREGVFVGTDGIPTLKKYDVIAKDAHWLEGQPILRGHTRPDEIVTYKHNKIGKIINVKPRPNQRDVTAVARYFVDKLSVSELDKIRSGQPYDGSIAYTCETVPDAGEFNGHKYNAVETTGYHFYHFAEVPEGACSVSKGCGFNLNSAGIDTETDGNKQNGTDNMKENCAKKKDENAAEVAEAPVEDVLVVDDAGNECKESEMVDGACPETADATAEEAPVDDTKASKTKASKTKASKTKSNEAGEDTDDVKENEASSRTVTVDVRVPDEFTAKLNAMFDENAALRNDNVTLKESVTALTARVDELVVKQNAAIEAEATAKEQRNYNAFYARLNAAAQPDAQKYYDEYKAQGISYMDERSDLFKSSAAVPTTKLMGVPSSEGASDLVTEKRKLRETLRRRNIA